MVVFIYLTIFFQVQHFAVKVQIQNVPPLTKTNESEIKKYFKKKFIVPNTTLRIVSNF